MFTKTKINLNQGYVGLRLLIIISTMLVFCSFSWGFDTVGVFASGESQLNSASYKMSETRIGQGQISTVNNLTSYSLLEGNNALIKFTSRSTFVTAPNSRGYTGEITDLVPGSKIIHIVNIFNFGTITANNCIISDVVPSNTHLYYNDTPMLSGAATSINYLGATNNAGPGSKIKFSFTLGPSKQAELSYTLTVD